MQGIYNCILEKNSVSRAYGAVAILWLQFVVRVMLYFPW